MIRYINPIAVVMDNSITKYFGNYFGILTNLVIFFSNILFLSKTRYLCFLLVGIMTINMSEVFNSVLKEACSLPFTALVQ